MAGEGPWTEYQNQPAQSQPAAEGPWTEYQTAPRPTLRPEEELTQSVPQGLRKTLEFMTGLPGEAYSGLADLAQWIQQNAPLPPMARRGFQEDIDAFRGARTNLLTGKDDTGTEHTFGLPTIGEVQQKITDPAFGRSPEMQTFAGRVGEGIGENLLGGGKSFWRDIVFPAVGAEVGGAVGEAVDPGGVGEDIGRFAGGVGGGAVGGAAVRGVRAGTLGNIEPRRAQLVRILADAGVPITAGQASGSPTLKYLEAGPFSGRPQNIANEQNRAYTRAIFGEAGINADAATPDVLTNAYDALGNEYDQIIARTGGVVLDDNLKQNLLDAAVDFQRLKNTDGGIAQDLFDRAFAAADANGGVIPADIYQSMSSDISRLMRKSTDPETLLALGEVKEALFDSITRNSGAELTGDWKDLNNRYRTFKLITKSMRGASEGSNVDGFISPDKFRQTMQGADPNFAMDQSRLAELARGGAVMKDVPQSGTPGRTALSMMLAGGGLAALDPNYMKAAMAAAAAPVAHEGIGRAVASRPVRTSLINQAMQPPMPILQPGDQVGWQALMALQNRLDEGRR